jgi:hypothetical protein
VDLDETAFVCFFLSIGRHGPRGKLLDELFVYKQSVATLVFCDTAVARKLANLQYVSEILSHGA